MPIARYILYIPRESIITCKNHVPDGIMKISIESIVGEVDMGRCGTARHQEVQDPNNLAPVSKV